VADRVAIEKADFLLSGASKEAHIVSQIRVKTPQNFAVINMRVTEEKPVIHEFDSPNCCANCAPFGRTEKVFRGRTDPNENGNKESDEKSSVTARVEIIQMSKERTIAQLNNGTALK
jgi:hypothetical protein